MAHNIWGFTSPGTYVSDALGHMMGGGARAGAGGPPRHTPVAPAHYTPSAVIPHHTEDYARLRGRAVAINTERMEHRPADHTKWRKTGLTEQEKFYLWNSQGGCCAAEDCRLPLDDRTMTIEHVKAKSKSPAATWDIRNMTILCGRCNSLKGDRTLPPGMDYHPSLAAKRYMDWAHGR